MVVVFVKMNTAKIMYS